MVKAAYPNDHNESPVALRRVMGWSELHGDMQSQAEMSWPPTPKMESEVTIMSVPIRCSRRRFEKGCP